MEARWGVLLAVVFWGHIVLALPTSLLEDAQAAEARIDTNKGRIIDIFSPTFIFFTVFYE